MKMKTLLLSASIACTAVAAQAETLNLMAYSGIFEQYYRKAVVEPFMAQNPDITVEYFGMPNSAQMLGTLRSQVADPQFDVAIMDITVSKAGTDDGVFAPLDESVTTHIKDLVPLARLEGTNAVGVTLDSMTMIYNKDLVVAPPTSWEDLWNPAYEGKIVLAAAPDTTGLIFTVVADRMAGGTDYKTSTEKGIEKVMTLAPSVQTWEPHPDVYQPVMTGSAIIGLGWNARAQILAGGEGSKLAVVMPKEGSGFQINAIGLIENAQNTDAAKRFIDYALSPETQAALANAMFYAPTNANAAALISKEALGKTVLSTTDSMLDLDWNVMAQIREGVAKEWRRRVIPLTR